MHVTVARSWSLKAHNEDPDRGRHPRFGISDDASVVHAVLEPVGHPGGQAGGQTKDTTAGTCAAAPLQ